MSKLSIAVVWHMHQPLYKDRLTRQYLMPWVRLHAIKDYLDMVLVLEKYPTLRQTFNLVPSLLEQLIDYGHHGAMDRALDLTLMPPREYCLDDLKYIFERFFDLNWERMVAPHPRYAELAHQRNALLATHPVEKAVRQWKEQDWLDLTTWFNLAWFDPLWQETDPFLRGLIEKGRGFTQGDRKKLVEKQREIIRRIIPTYRKLVEAGRIELTTTPYYHPILPLLADTEAARVARPGLPLPPARFKRPEDARAQVRKGIDFFEKHFGFRPVGMWPSEESVSPEIIPLMVEEGVKWAISDEGVLAHTIGKPLARDAHGHLLEPSMLYQPYWVNVGGQRVAMVFRDIRLSDMIGFTYSKHPAEVSVRDLMTRLKTIHKNVGDGSHLVTIALDGENCWEYYPRDGWDFLETLYAAIEADPDLEMVTVGEYLNEHPPTRTLPTIHSGSWINSDFTTWIGEPTKNRAWDYLCQAREALATREGLNLAGWEQAREEIYIAEGSDWFWWFGEGHSSGQDELFDFQFRLHLQNAYRMLGLAVPEHLTYPVTRPAPRIPNLPMIATEPRLDGLLGSSADWIGAGIFDPSVGQGAMHQAATGIQKVLYAHNERELLMRLEFAPTFMPTPGDVLAIYICYPGQPRINSPAFFTGAKEHGGTATYQFAHEIRFEWANRVATISYAGEYQTWVPIDLAAHSAYEETLDLAIPFRVLSVVPGQEIMVVAMMARNGVITEAAPRKDGLAMRVPKILARV